MNLDLDKILILDFGSQFTKLIARRIREQNVYCEIQNFDIPVHEINEFAPKGIILSGGPASVLSPDSPKVDPRVLGMGIPILGICYGMQLVCLMDGGTVKPSSKREYGEAYIEILNDTTIFKGIESRPMKVWMSHGDKVVTLPHGFKSIAKSENCEFAAIQDDQKDIYCLQFHSEVTHTPEGMKVIRNFIFDICHCQPNWNMGAFVEETIASIRKQVGKGKVICGLSGGVDSAVAAVLIHKAIGDQLTCIFVDNGVLRKNEREKVSRIFRESFKINLVVVDAIDRFLRKFRGIEDPEAKRKIIGNEFISIFDEEATRIKNVKFLAQGTLYPDVIESTSFKGPSSVIKSHHNVGGLPEKMGLELVEPLRELFKDEVRQVGRELEIPEEIVERQPFPGPGLAIRIIGEVTKERLDMLREADDVMMDEVKKAGWYNKVWQTFCVLLPVKTVGVMGDERTYENVIAVRGVESQDGMTADWVKLPYDLLGRISNRIINEVSGINRVVYDISSKPPATIEWE